MQNHDDQLVKTGAPDGQQWRAENRRFGLTQEQTHAVPAVWRRRRQRQRERMKQQSSDR